MSFGVFHTFSYLERNSKTPVIDYTIHFISNNNHGKIVNIWGDNFWSKMKKINVLILMQLKHLVWKLFPFDI